MKVSVKMIGEGWDAANATEIGTIECDDDSSDIAPDLAALLEHEGSVIYPTDRIFFKIAED